MQPFAPQQKQRPEVTLNAAQPAVSRVITHNSFELRWMTAYFDGVWAQINNDEQRHLLRVMAQQGVPWQREAIGAAAGLDDKRLHEALYWAKRHDVVWQRGEQ